jgi:hypothetical protein
MAKQTSAPFEPHKFSPEELERMKTYLEVLSDREEIIGYLDNYAYFFADWSLIINESVQEMIERKQKLKIACDSEKEMLGDLSFLFTKLSYFSGLLSDWHKELTVGKENTEQMIEQGTP